MKTHTCSILKFANFAILPNLFKRKYNNINYYWDFNEKWDRESLSLSEGEKERFNHVNSNRVTGLNLKNEFISWSVSLQKNITVCLLQVGITVRLLNPEADRPQPHYLYRECQHFPCPPSWFVCCYWQQPGSSHFVPNVTHTLTFVLTQCP